MGVACLLYTEQHPHLIMGKGQNEGGFSEEQVQMYKDCFKLMTSTRTVPWTKMISVELLTTLVSSCPSLSSTVFLVRLVVPAPTRTWSRCSRGRWPETATTPMTSLSRLSRPTTWTERLTPRCSSTL